MCTESIKSPSLCLLVKTCLKGAFIYIYMRDCAALGHTRATKPGEEEQSDSGFYTMWTSLEEEKQVFYVKNKIRLGVNLFNVVRSGGFCFEMKQMK